MAGESVPRAPEWPHGQARPGRWPLLLAPGSHPGGEGAVPPTPSPAAFLLQQLAQGRSLGWPWARWPFRLVTEGLARRASLCLWSARFSLSLGSVGGQARLCRLLERSLHP